MSLFISLLIALSALTMSASSTDKQASTQAPEQASQALSQAPQCEEDEPCFRCMTMGNHYCPQTMITDAWASIDDAGIKRDPAQGTLLLEYLGFNDRMAQNTALGEFSVASIDFPGQYHYFQWTVVTKA